MLPSLLSIQLGTMAGAGQLQPQAGFTAQTTGQSTARIDLGDGYHLAIDERNSEMTIVNDATGQSTRVWGDPRVTVNGKHQFDFYGTTTFELDNGTKILVNTVQGKSNPNVYFASRIVVTRGANAVVIDGISQQQLGTSRPASRPTAMGSMPPTATASRYRSPRAPGRPNWARR